MPQRISNKLNESIIDSSLLTDHPECFLKDLALDLRDARAQLTQLRLGDTGILNENITLCAQLKIAVEALEYVKQRACTVTLDTGLLGVVDDIFKSADTALDRIKQIG